MTNPTFPLVHDANHIRQVHLPDGMKAAEAIKIADEHFNRIGMRCWRWEFSLSAEPQTAQQMAGELNCAAGIAKPRMSCCCGNRIFL